MFYDPKRKLLLINNPGTNAECLAIGLRLPRLNLLPMTIREITSLLEARGESYSDCTTILTIAPSVERFARAVTDDLVAQGEYVVTHVGLVRTKDGVRMTGSMLDDRFRHILERTRKFNSVEHSDELDKARTDSRGYWPQSLWLRKVTTLLDAKDLPAWANYNRLPTLGTPKAIPRLVSFLAGAAAAEIIDLYSMDKVLLENSPVWTVAGAAPHTVMGPCRKCEEKQA